ncbi:MAG: PAS domain S-box protein [Opitutaceae bacterium]|nr:PAS domain S-box protein [Opitutaceae bacterium]
MVGGPADEARTVASVKAGAEDYVSSENLERLPAVLTCMDRRLHAGASGEPAADAEDRHYAAFVSLARSKIWQSADVDAVIREVTATVARALAVERVSFWRLNHDGTAIDCQDLYEATPARHSAGVTLHRTDYPAYFKALAGHDVIPAVDACHDKRTREFAQTYLVPLGIASMLDAPVLVGGHLAGVLCVEQVGSRRRWSPPECNLALSAASLLALLISREAQAISEAHLRTVVENEPACVKLVSADGRLLEMNPAGLQMIEAGDGRDVFGRPVLDVVHPDDRKRFVALHSRVLKGETGDLRFRIIGCKGTVRWMETHSAPMPDPSGRIAGVLSVTHDVTPQVKNEAALARHAQQQELLAQLSVEAMRSTELEGTLQRATAWTTRIMAVPLGKVLRWNSGTGEFELVAGTGWKPGQVGSARVAGGLASQAGYTLRLKAPVMVEDLAGEKRFKSPPLLSEHGVVSGLSVPIEREGKVWGVLAVHDRSVRHFDAGEIAFLQSVANLLGVAVARFAAVQELAASEANFRCTFAAAAVGLVISTPEGVFLEANAAYCRMLGYTAEELRKISLWTLTDPDDRERNRALHRDLLEGRIQSYVLEKRYRAKDGRTVWAQVTASAHRDAAGRVHQIIGVAEDITVRRQLTAEKEQLVADLHERVKELRALEQTAALLRREDLEPSDLLEAVVELIPPAMQYPEITVVRLTFGDLTRSSTGFAVTRLRLESSFTVGGTAGRLEIGYRETESVGGGAAFLPEEQKLADSLVEMLRIHFERLATSSALRRSQFRQRLILDSVDEGIHGIDLEGRIIFENAAGVKLLGWPERELIGQPSHALVHHHHPDGRPYAVEDCPIYRTLRDGQVRHVDTEMFFRRDGSGFPVAYVVSPVRDDGGNITGAVVCFRDITARKAAEARLQREESVLQLAGKIAKVAGWTVTVPDTRLYWSKHIWDLVDYPKDKYPTLEEILPYYLPESRERLAQAIGRCAAEGTAFDIETQVVTPAGRQMWARVAGEASRDAQGKIVAVHGAFSDITEQKKTELEIRSLARRLGATLESITDAFFTLDREWRFAYLNPEAERVLERSQADLLGHNVWAEFPAALGTVFEQEYRRAMDTGETVVFEAYYPAPLDKWFEVRGYPSEEGLAVYFQDVTERRRTTEALRQSEERFREMADNIGDVFYNYDPVNNRLRYANAAYEKIFGRSLASAFANPLDYLEAVLPADRPAAEEAFRRQCAGATTDIEFRILRPDGTIRWVYEHTTPIVDAGGRVERLVGTMRDITLSKTAHEALQVSEERFRLLAGATNDAIWDLDLCADRLWWSDGHTKLFGHPAGVTKASTAAWRAHLHPEDRERVLHRVEAVIHGDDSNYTNEYRYRRADGTYAYVLDRAQIIRDGSGRAVRLIGGMTDLSAIKQAEEEAHRQSEALASIVDTLQDISSLRKPLTEVMAYMAHRAQQLTGADGAVVEMIEGDHQVYLAGSGTVADRIGDKIPLVGSLSGLAVTTNQALICTDSETDDRIDRAASRRVGLRSMIVAPLRDGETTVGTLKVISGEPARFGVRDRNNLQILVESLGSVIQRQQATERLQASEERYRMLFDSNPHPMWVFDCETFRFLAVNAAALEHYGYSEQEFMAMTVLNIRAKQDQVDLEAARAKLPAAGKEFGYRFHRKKNGTVIEMEVLSDALRFKDRPARLVLAQDVTERRRAERKIREQAELLDKAQDAILVRDLGHRITYWNKSAERLYGWPAAEVRGRSVRELLYFDPKDFDQATAEVLAKGEWTGELTQQRHDGQGITIEGRWTLLRDAEGNPESVLAINTDITERKKLEQQFLRAQRMESIGTLAGGIAHDLNNLLAPIAMGVELLRLNESNPRNQPVIDNIERSAKRGADLVKQVLSFARGVEGSRVAVHLKHIIHDIEAIVKNTFPKNIRLETGVPKDLWLVLGDPTQLNQVLLNLSVNARDAMPSGGLLSIRASNIELDQQYAVMNRGVPAGRYVVLEVSDTGSGIPPEILDRIFDPFFTTKEVGKGTGLGLSTLQGIVRSHGGFVNVYSEVGRGSTFKIYLPVHETGEADPASEPDGGKLPRGQGELILVVDDETTILSVTAQTLEAFGYRALTAEDGAQAIGLFAQRRDEIAVVLTDMMMPVMDGPALVAALRRINPRVHIIAASGLNANGNVARASAAGVTHFLAKPYSADALLRLLAHVLRGTPSRSPFPPPSK